MKYVIVIPDGCADEPQDSLGGKTPLESAATPAMDEVARLGIVGRANHTPSHLPAGSDVANMSLFGYDPVANFTGRAPLEAAAQGIELSALDWAIRCNLVTIQNQIMRDFTAGHITTEQAKLLLATAQERLDDKRFEFVPGVSYRNLLLFRGQPDVASPFSFETRCTPPHDLTDKSVEHDFPRGPGSDILSRLMSQSVDWFADHEVNRDRIAAGHLPATNLWLWGLGQRPQLAPFKDVFGKSGAMITAVDLLRGLAKIVGWDRIEVPGATGYIDTDYAAKGRYGIEAVEHYELVCIHVEATDEASHEGDVAGKIKALERIDADIVAPVFKKLRTLDEWRLLVTPDHPTFVRTKTHTNGDVPFTMCGTGIAADTATIYGESAAANSAHVFDQGFQLMPFFIGKT